MAITLNLQRKYNLKVNVISKTKYYPTGIHAALGETTTLITSQRAALSQSWVGAELR